MAKSDSIFGAELDRLRRLLTVGEDEAGEESDRPTLRTASLQVLTERPGMHVGRYKLLSVLGEGGMGIVYLAEQAEPIKRQVAVKVIKPGMDSKRVIGRFEAERQALALLDHPNIAHVHDAGTTEAGRPYFVMEYVEGLAITDYCDEHKLPIEQRLRLFQQVCEAVQHAHQKGIIHRDIKPSNILVAADGDKAIPKIIDFGVAKAIAEPLTEGTLRTEDSRLLGTPEYMSPEQADMASEDIDTRSDVYSLGVLLYVLLTAVLPCDAEKLRESGIEHIRKTIRETDPKTPSTRLTKLGEEARKVAENRSTQVATLAKRLHKELEWIPLKAMRKERSERYRSASELADDIENYLTGEPLIAGPPGTLYRLKKFVRRHTAAVAGATAVTVALMGGLVVSTALYFRAERLRVQAQEAAEEAKRAAINEAAARVNLERANVEAQAITEFLTEDVLGSADQVKGRDATVIDVLDAAAAKLDEGALDDQPLVEVSIRSQLAWLYDNLGFERKAMLHRERICQLGNEKNAILPGSGPAITMNNLACCYERAGEYQKAESLFKELIEQRMGLHNWYRSNLATTYVQQGRYEEAQRIFLEVTQIPWWENKVAAGYPYLVNYVVGLAETYQGQGRYDEAEQTFTRAFALASKLKRKAPQARNKSKLARLYVAQGRYPEAEELFMEAINIAQRQLPGKLHPDTLHAMNGLAALRTKVRQHDEAESLFKEALEGRTEKLGDDHPETLETLNDFGVLRREQQHYGQAESVLRQALDGRQRKLGPNHPACFESMHELAVLYIRQARYGDAEPLLLDALHGREAKLGPDHPHTLDSLRELVRLYEAWNKPDEAATWRAKLPSAASDTVKTPCVLVPKTTI